MRAIESAEIKAIINPVDAISAVCESLAQKLRGVIRFGHDCTRPLDKLIQADFEVTRRKNIICVRGKTETDSKKFVDPKGRARGHTGEMRMHMPNPHFTQPYSDVNRLVQPEEISASPPFLQRCHNLWIELSFF